MSKTTELTVRQETGPAFQGKTASPVTNPDKAWERWRTLIPENVRDLIAEEFEQLIAEGRPKAEVTTLLMKHVMRGNITPSVVGTMLELYDRMFYAAAVESGSGALRTLTEARAIISEKRQITDVLDFDSLTAESPYDKIEVPVTAKR